MFKKTLLLASLVITAYALGIYLFAIHVRAEDESTYHELIDESINLRSKHAFENNPAIQYRSGVQKDIWALEGSERNHIRLVSRDSELTIRQKRGKFEADETLHTIDCWMQEEIDRLQNIQQVRSIQATEGLYAFPAHEFIAQNVHLSFYRLAGDQLPQIFPKERPYLKGVASEVFFRTSSKVPTFTAYHLRAEFDPVRGLP